MTIPRPASRFPRGGWSRFMLLCGASVFGFCVWSFLELAEDVPTGEHQRFDEQVLRNFRHADDLARPIGPPSLKEVARDVSALGSVTGLGLATVAVLGFLGLSGRPRSFFLVLFAVGGGTALGVGLKHLSARARPEVVPHLTEVSSSSFPSGHSMLSAVVYLTLGVILARATPRRTLKVYVLGFALFLTLIVGVSRVYLGVHYPTDVLAGWTAGIAWALLCAAVEGMVPKAQPRVSGR